MNAVRALLVVALLVVSAIVPRAARAEGVASFAEHGPILLDDGGAGRITLRNTGSSPLHVITIYARSNERDPRIPGTLNATFEGGGTKADLAPGGSRVLTVKWDRHGARMSQLFGHVVVESSDPAAPQVAVGVIGRAPSSLGFLVNHLGTWLILLPLLGALLMAPLHLVRRTIDEKAARFVALSAVGLQAALAVWAARSFDPLAGRADGNDGLQLMERARLFGPVEWFLGIDGASMPLLLTVIALGVAGVVASFRLERHHQAYFAAYLALVGCAVGAVLAVDAMLLVLFVGAALIPAFILIARFGGAHGPRAAIRVFILGAVAVACLATVVLALHRNADPTFLVDGTRAQSFAWTELARGEWLDRTHAGLLFFGKPFVKSAFIAVFVAGAILLAAAPLHGALGEVLGEAPIGGAMLFAGATGVMGSQVLLRFGLFVLPAGARWAAPSIAALGAAGVVWGGLAALGERDLRRMVAHVAVAHSGLILLGFSAGTPQGIAGAIAHTASRGLIVAMLLSLASVLHDRVRVTAIDRFGGLFRAMPRFGALSLVACLVAIALPGTAAFASALLAIVGALPSHRIATATAVLGLALLGVAVIVAFRRVLLGELDERWRRSAELEPFGGAFPDLDGRELSLLVALAIVALGLGLVPQPFLRMSHGTLSDLDERVNVERVAAVDRCERIDLCASTNARALRRGMA